MTVQEILAKAEADISEMLQIPVVVTYTSEVTMHADIIMQACAEHFKVDVEDMKRKNRFGLLPLARQCYCYISREKMRYKLAYIGFCINWKHDSVIRGCEKVKTMLSVKDHLVTEAIDSILKKLFHTHAS